MAALCFLVGCPKGAAKETSSAQKAYQSGLRLQKAGKLEAAEKQFTLAYKKRPGDYVVLSRLVEVRLYLNRTREAWQVARAYFDDTPGDPNGYLLYAKALVAKRDLGEAYDVLTQLLELDDGNARAWEERGKVEIARRRFERGIADIRRAMLLAPNSPTYKVSLASAYHRTGSHKEAESLLQEAITADPSNARSHLIMGNVLRAQSEYQRALGHHLKASGLAPRWDRAWFELGVTQNGLGDNWAAERSLDKAVRINPHEAYNWYVYGEVLRNLENWGQAAKAYRRALKISPKHPKAKVKLGFVLSNLGSLGEAEVILTEALQKSPRDPYVHLNLGLVYARANKTSMAIAALNEFLRLAPPNDGDIPRVKLRLQELRKSQ